MQGVHGKTTLEQPASRFRRSLAALFCGVFVGAIMLVLSLSYTSLIFSGAANAFLPVGLVISLTGVVVVGLVSALFSDSRHLVIQLDDDTAAVFALMMASILATLPTNLSASAALPLILLHLFFACFMTGLMLALCGYLKLGNLVQFMPYSVMGGYFAAVGWLMITGTIVMLSESNKEFSGAVNQLFEYDVLIRWLPALAIGAVIRYLTYRLSTGLVLSASLVLFISGFYFIATLGGASITDLERSGFLIGPFDSLPPSLFHPIWNADWSRFSWSIISQSGGAVASIGLIALLSFILTISAIALTTEKDLDLNRELKVAGVGNMLAASMGGLLALPSLSISRLSYELNRQETRIAGLAIAALGVGVFYLAMDVLALLPKMVLGALSIYIGLGFTVEWLIRGYKRFGALEYSVIPVILIISIFVGFLPSILVGVVLAVVLFAIKYSQVRVVRYESNGQNFRSSLVRDSNQNALLQRLGNQVRFFQLQGFLFFGTAGNLYKRVMKSVAAESDDGLPNARFVILDFSKVSGVDSSAMLNLEKLSQRLREQQIQLLGAGIKPDIKEILNRGRVSPHGNASAMDHHYDMDSALQWCEDQILVDCEHGPKMGRGLFERIADEVKSETDIGVLAKYVTRHSAEARELIAKIGEHSDDVFFLETCTASAYIVDSEGAEHRVSGAGRGAIFGEIGFLLGVPRTANVKVDVAGDYYSLNSQALKRMEQDNPELAVVITHYLAKTVTERLANTTSALRSLI